MYQVKTEAFEGPFDLLLHLIKKEEVDIYDIPIAHITREYLGYINLMKSLDLNLASEFLVMAALLLAIKSKMMLPRQKIVDEAGEEIEEEDPRLELARQLAEYKKYKEVSTKLEDRFKHFQMVYSRPKEKIEDELIECDLFGLLDAFRRLLNRSDEEEKMMLQSELTSINLRMKDLEEIIASRKRVSFSDLFEGLKKKVDLIITFLAILELIRLQKILVQQKKNFGQIWVYRI